MKVFMRISRASLSPALLFPHYTPRGLVSSARALSQSPSYQIHSKKELSYNLVEIPKHYNYQEYLNNLKSLPWVNYKIDCLNKLLKNTQQIKNKDFKHLRSSINDILYYCKLITDARAYHKMNIDPQAAIKHASQLIFLTFGKNSNLTHQSIIEEQSDSYIFIQFGTYFDMCAVWKIQPPKEVLEYYMHSYMNILFDRNLLRYILAYQAIRQVEESQTVRDIVDKSEIGISKMIGRLDGKIEGGAVLNPYEMAVYLKYVRNEVNRLQDEQKRQQMVQVLRRYVIGSQRAWTEVELHCENMVFCLFLLLQQDDPDITIEIYGWICERYSQAHHHNDNLLQYLTILNSHQDKLTCLKVDIFLNLLRANTNGMKMNDLRPQIEGIILSIDGLNVSHWRYKYIFWLLDSILNKYPHQSLPYINKICSSLAFVGLNPNEKISSLVIFLSQLTQRYFSTQLSDIIQIHYSIADWFVRLPKPALFNQNPSDLCQLLTMADRHPTLQKIYTPYLAQLLELSLGHFLWADHTKLYYYSIRFGVDHYSEQALWNMQYVRRYILNQYSTMGLRRREIPEDSYFYKIIGITTPEKFYKNYLKHEE